MVEESSMSESAAIASQAPLERKNPASQTVQVVELEPLQVAQLSASHGATHFPLSSK